MQTLTVYTKNNCPYCVQVKNFLHLAGISYREINIEDDSQARDFVVDQGHRTMPQIYLNDKVFVQGGWQGLSQLSRQDLHDRLNNQLDLGTL